MKEESKNKMDENKIMDVTQDDENKIHENKVDVKEGKENKMGKNKTDVIKK